jgi:hypothetical protein
MKAFGTQIYEAVHQGRLAQPFNAEAVRTACPEWADRTYRVFLSNHAIGNPGQNTELFLRVAPGLYRLSTRA